MKTALLVGAIVIGGATAGLALERAGVLSPLGETAAISTLDEVPVYACPDAGVAGVLHRGDRVFATGRTGDGGWVEVRSPYDTSGRVWVEARWLDPDSDLAALPASQCELPVDAAGEPLPTDTTTPTTTPPTTEPATTTPPTTEAPTTTPPTTQAPTTTPPTTEPPDGEGPAVNLFQSSESDIWEDEVFCAANPRTAQISAVVTDSSGISSVQLSWSVGSSSGTVAMPEVASAIYSVAIGPYGTGTISGSPVAISLQLTARDGFNNPTTVSSSTLVTLHDCALG